MSYPRNSGFGWRVLLIVVPCLVLFTLPVVRASEVSSTQPAPSKLTTVLAEVARSVPQESGPVSLTIARPAMRLSREALPKSVRDAMQVRMLRVNSNAEAQVYILMNAVTEENLNQLKANGVTIEMTDAAGHRVQARIPVTRLQAVGALPFVNFVRLPSYAVRMTGSVETEGDAILQADKVRQQLQVDGSSVFVGVISDGIKGIFNTGCTSCAGVASGPIETLDLPAATGTRNASGVLTSSTGGIVGQSFQANGDLEGIIPGCGFAGAGAEGTALLEIIHDIAPGAQLSFANADTDLAFNQAVNTLAQKNDIVMDDLGFFGLPQDGTSTISVNTANALNSASNPIRAYYTAVGNLSDSHYLGPYRDSGTDGFPITNRHGDLHLFQSNVDTADTLGSGPQTFNEIKLQGTTSTKQSTGGEVIVILSWDDTFGSSSNDFDLFLVQHGTNTIVASDIGKTCEGSTLPVACLSFVNNGSADTFYDILIQNPSNASATKTLNLFAFTPECAFGSLISLGPSRAKMNFNTSSHSVIAESDAGGSPVSVVSVGAICSASVAAQQSFATSLFPDPSCLDTTNSTIEYFSSQGPTLDGRNKPDISAIDGVSVTGAGSFENPFFGTSAATPHIAGIAALVLESKACLLTNVTGEVDSVTARTDLRNLIMDNAFPLGGATPNNIFGAGIADALASANATIPFFSGPSTLFVGGNTPAGASLTAPQLGFPEPTTCPLAMLSWTGGCGTGPATSMNCPFGTTSVNVMASNVLPSASALVYSPAATVQVVVANFSLGLSPSSVTVPAGQPASYTLTASAQGGTFPSAITLVCSNLPTGTTCSFNPSQVTPGAVSTQSILTISTTAHGSVPPANWQPMGRLMWPVPFTDPKHGFPPLTLLLATAMVAAMGLMGMRLAPSAFKRRFAALGALSLALVFLSMQVACGGGGSNQPPPPTGTPAGTYTISIAGTSGTLVHSSTATLVVQ